jgi:hypothetical protein
VPWGGSPLSRFSQERCNHQHILCLFSDPALEETINQRRQKPGERGGGMIPVCDNYGFGWLLK